MRAMKDSGIKWMGEIPEEWEVIPMKAYFYMKGRIGWQGLKADEFIDEGPFLVTGTDFLNGKVNWETCYHISEERFNEAPEIHVKNNDILITKDGTIGKLAYIVNKPNKVSLNSHLLILRPTKPFIDNYFIYWALQSPNFGYYSGLVQSGTTMASLSQEKIGNYRLALPPLSEQQRIATYLDTKCGEIDELIGIQEKFIEELKTYKQSVITEAVTKGLNPNATLKDSGVEWIGEIPEEWEVCRLKNIANLVLGKMLESKKPECENDEYTLEYYLKSRNIGDLELLNNIENVDQMWFNEYERHIYELKEGDIVMNEGGDIGKVSLWKDKGYKCYIQNSVHKITPLNNVPAFLQYALYHAKVKGYYQSIVNAISIAHLTKEKLCNTPLALPPLSEQRSIATYLDNKCSQIDSLIALKQTKIDELKSFKKSLIYEYVTGKKTVPETV